MLLALVQIDLGLNALLAQDCQLPKFPLQCSTSHTWLHLHGGLWVGWGCADGSFLFCCQRNTLFQAEQDGI